MKKNENTGVKQSIGPLAAGVAIGAIATGAAAVLSNKDNREKIKEAAQKATDKGKTLLAQTQQKVEDVAHSIEKDMAPQQKKVQKAAQQMEKSIASK